MVSLLDCNFVTCDTKIHKNLAQQGDHSGATVRCQPRLELSTDGCVTHPQGWPGGPAHPADGRRKPQGPFLGVGHQSPLVECRPQDDHLWVCWPQGRGPRRLCGHSLLAATCGQGCAGAAPSGRSPAPAQRPSEGGGSRPRACPPPAVPGLALGDTQGREAWTAGRRGGEQGQAGLWSAS